MKIVSTVVGRLKTNCYLLCDEESGCCAVIDPGAEAEKILELIQGTGTTPTAIFLTHGHADHTGAVAQIQARYSIPAYLGEWEPQGVGSAFPQLEHICRYGEGDLFSVGTLEVCVLATPGHSAGSVTLRVNDALFTGDTLFKGNCGSAQYHTGSMAQMFASLRCLGSLEKNFDVYPGHMERTSLDTERLENVFLRSAMGL